MTEHTYKHIRLTGSSETGSDDAIKNAISKAAESIEHLNWFKVVEIRGHIDENKIQHWQVTVEVAFRLEG